MKLIIPILLALSGATAISQTIELPINIKATVAFPIGPNPIPNNATNAPQIFVMTNNVIDPSIGPRLIRNFSAPTAFTLGKFHAGAYVTLYYRNPNRVTMTWPPGITWITPPPTNQVRGVVVFENVLAEIWGSALNQ